MRLTNLGFVWVKDYSFLLFSLSGGSNFVADELVWPVAMYCAHLHTVLLSSTATADQTTDKRGWNRKYASGGAARQFCYLLFIFQAVLCCGQLSAFFYCLIVCLLKNYLFLLFVKLRFTVTMLSNHCHRKLMPIDFLLRILRWIFRSICAESFGFVGQSILEHTF